MRVAKIPVNMKNLQLRGEEYILCNRLTLFILKLKIDYVFPYDILHRLSLYSASISEILNRAENQDLITGGIFNGNRSEKVDSRLV